MKCSALALQGLVYNFNIFCSSKKYIWNNQSLKVWNHHSIETLFINISHELGYTQNKLIVLPYCYNKISKNRFHKFIYHKHHIQRQSNCTIHLTPSQIYVCEIANINKTNRLKNIENRKSKPLTYWIVSFHKMSFNRHVNT